MNKLQRKTVSIVGSVAVLLAQAAPAFATDLVIVGNGSESNSTIDMQSSSTTTVVQKNNTDVDNKVKVSADTGNNTASDNTGGDARIQSGDSTTVVELENVAGSNVAEVERCGGCDDGTNIVIDGNGTDTTNLVDYDRNSATTLFQTNNTEFDNEVNVDATTGGNQVDDNTGADEAVVVTGDANVAVSASNMADSNTASVHGGNSDSDSDNSGVNLWIHGNGSDSRNTMRLDLKNTTLLSQMNDTQVANKFRVDADTGSNTVSDSTGGMVAVGTGDANVYANVDNAAGFNTANVEGCCADGVYAKIGENGTETTNHIGASLGANLEVFQENSCGEGHGDLWDRWFHHNEPCFDNDLELEAYTGKNESDDNTGGTDADPIVVTGDSNVGVSVGNMGGSNTYGSLSGNGFEWPSHDNVSSSQSGSSLNFDFSFDFSAFMAGILGS